MDNISELIDYLSRVSYEEIGFDDKVFYLRTEEISYKYQGVINKRFEIYSGCDEKQNIERVEFPYRTHVFIGWAPREAQYSMIDNGIFIDLKIVLNTKLESLSVEWSCIHRETPHHLSFREVV